MQKVWPAVVPTSTTLQPNSVVGEVIIPSSFTTDKTILNVVAPSYIILPNINAVTGLCTSLERVCSVVVERSCWMLAASAVEEIWTRNNTETTLNAVG